MNGIKMIKLDLTLVPYGSRLHKPEPLLSAELYTVPGKEPRHGYLIVDNEGHVIADGAVPKTYSGHRNPLHLLRAVLADCDLDALEKDYIKTPYDR